MQSLPAVSAKHCAHRGLYSVGSSDRQQRSPRHGAPHSRTHCWLPTRHLPSTWGILAHAPFSEHVGSIRQPATTSHTTRLASQRNPRATLSVHCGLVQPGFHPPCQSAPTPPRHHTGAHAPPGVQGRCKVRAVGGQARGDWKVEGAQPPPLSLPGTGPGTVTSKIQPTQYIFILRHHPPILCSLHRLSTFGTQQQLEAFVLYPALGRLFQLPTYLVSYAQ